MARALAEPNWIIPDLVLAEMLSPLAEAVRQQAIPVRGFRGEQLVEIEMLLRRYHRISVADAAGLVLARSEGWLLLTGDAALREAATENSVEVHGVLWLLDSFVRDGSLATTTAAAALTAMVRAGSRLPAREVALRLRAWGP